MSTEEPIQVVMHQHVLMVSDQQLADAREMTAAVDRWMNATPEQRAEWQHQAAARRAEERADAEQMPLTFDSLLARMDWSREYAEHFVQPYCECGPHRHDDGWYRCPHAEDLGLDV